MNIFNSISYFEKSIEECLFPGFGFGSVVIKFQIVVEELMTTFIVFVTVSQHH